MTEGAIIGAQAGMVGQMIGCWNRALLPGSTTVYSAQCYNGQDLYVSFWNIPLINQPVTPLSISNVEPEQDGNYYESEGGVEGTDPDQGINDYDPEPSMEPDYWGTGDRIPYWQGIIIQMGGPGGPLSEDDVSELLLISDSIVDGSLPVMPRMPRIVGFSINHLIPESDRESAREAWYQANRPYYGGYDPEPAE